VVRRLELPDQVAGMVVTELRESRKHDGPDPR
jgi:hypothetical protein